MKGDVSVNSGTADVAINDIRYCFRLNKRKV